MMRGFLRQKREKFFLVLLTFLISIVVLGCSDDDPVDENNGEISDEEIWDVISDQTAAPETDDGKKTERFSTGTFDDEPHVPQFEKPDLNTLVEIPNLAPLNQDQAMIAEVYGDRLEFPMEMQGTANSWEPGQLVVSPQGGPKNPFGFARKVEEVTTEDGKVIVKTIRAGLSDVVTGDLVMTLDPDKMTPLDMDSLDPEWAKENLGYDPIPNEPEEFGWNLYLRFSGRSYFLGKCCFGCK